MTQRMGEYHNAPTIGSSKRLPRRRFLDRLAGSVTGAALVLSGCSTDPVIRTQDHQTIAKVRRRDIKPEGTPLGRLVLDFLPAGYAFLNAIEMPREGFQTEDWHGCMVYADPEIRQGYRYPFVVYVSTGEPSTLGACRELSQGEETAVELNGRPSVIGTYFDGMWAMPTEDDVDLGYTPRVRIWAVGRGHSLIFRLGDLVIGLRGSISAGVDHGVLLGVASGMRLV